MEEFLSSIGIHDEGQRSSNGNYIIDFDSIKDYSKAFYHLDSTDELEELEESSVVSSQLTNIIYTNDKYIITLTADFDHDKYTLVMQEI